MEPNSMQEPMMRKIRGAVSTILAPGSGSVSQKNLPLNTFSTDFTSKEPLFRLADRWRQVQGEDRWSGMLDPLDFELRKELIRYGDLIQVMYDAFDYGPHSKYAGSSRFGKSALFQEVGLDDPLQGRSTDYEVTKFIYATSETTSSSAFILRSFWFNSWRRETNWNGYIAVANDAGKRWLGRRDIVIVFRGTLRNLEWVDNFHVKLVKIPPLEPYSASNSPSHSCNLNVKIATEFMSRNERLEFDANETGLNIDGNPSCWVWPWPKSSLSDELKKEKDCEDILIHEGWMLIYTSKNPSEPLGQKSAREQIVQEVRRLVRIYKDDNLSITVVGHSLGAALAVLCAYDLADLGINTKLNIEGNLETIPVTAFSFGTPGVGNSSFKKKAAQLPGLRLLRICNANDVTEMYPGSFLGYEHAGEKLQFDSSFSPYLRMSRRPGDQHNLQANLHMIAGMQGSNSPKKFELVIERDIALVNKCADILKDEFSIPANWWQQRNKDTGTDDRKPHELPSIDNPDFN